MPAQKKYPDELRQRSVRLVLAAQCDPSTAMGALGCVAEHLGFGPPAGKRAHPPATVQQFRDEVTANVPRRPRHQCKPRLRSSIVDHSVSSWPRRTPASAMLAIISTVRDCNNLWPPMPTSSFSDRAAATPTGTRLERPSALSQGTARTTPLPCPQRLGVGLPIALAESRVLTRQT